MAITYPIILPAQGVRSITMRARDSVAVSTSPFTGQQQVQAHQAQWWEADVMFPPMKQDGLADDMAAALTSLRGQYGTFLLGDSSRKTPRGPFTLGSNKIAPSVYGASQTGLLLITRGWAISSTALILSGDYIQLGAQNLLKYSEDFSHADWVKNNVSISANITTGPDGTSTADRLTATTGDCYVVQSVSGASPGVYTFSVWIRIDSGTIPFDVAINNGYGYSGSSQTLTLTSSWQRFSVTAYCYAGADLTVVFGRTNGIPPGAAVYAWGAQLNRGYTADAYVTTTSSGITGTPRLHKVTSIASSDINGQVALEIWPRLRESPPNGAYIKTTNCVGTFRLASNERNWSVGPDKIYDIGFSAVEAI
jgi:hypothetical protein